MQRENQVAEIVGALGVPHTPFFPALVERDGPDCETARFFAAVRKELEAMRPDLIVMYDTDHLNTFFLDNLPVFALGVTEAFQGPNDEPRAVPIYTIKSRPDVAAHLRRVCIDGGFDLALTQDFTVDHSFVVPLHFMTPAMRVPVIPVFVSGHIPPLPSARRCYDLGVTVKRAIESWPDKLRVVVIGSGSFSLEVFGPRIAPGKSDGVPDPDWAKRVCVLLEQGATETLLAEATSEQMLRAGNVGGELLDWIAMLGAVGARRPKFVTPQMEQGHAYAAWSWS
jgi:gallate dioxygenase